MRLKAAGGDNQASIAQTLSEAPIQSVSVFGGRRVGKRRTIASTAVSIQGELRNHKNRAASVGKRSIHFALVVVEDAEGFDLIG